MPGVPSAYTAIWDYLDWIHDKVSVIDPYTVNTPLPPNRDSSQGPLPIMARANPIDEDSGSPPGTTAAPTTMRPTTTTPRATPPPPPRLLKDVIDLAFG